MGQGNSKGQGGPKKDDGDERPKKTPSSVRYFSEITTKYDPDHSEEEDSPPLLELNPNDDSKHQTQPVLRESPRQVPLPFTLFHPKEHFSSWFSTKVIAEINDFSDLLSLLHVNQFTRALCLQKKRFPMMKAEIKSFTLTQFPNGFFKGKTLMEICLESKNCELFRMVLTWAHGPGSDRWRNQWSYREKCGEKIPSTDKKIATAVSDIIASQLTQHWEGSGIVDLIVGTNKLSPQQKIKYLRVFFEVSPKSLRHPNHGVYDTPPRCLGIPFFCVAKCGTPELFECLLGFKVFTRKAVADYVDVDSRKTLLQLAQEKKNQAMIQYLEKLTEEVNAEQANSTVSLNL